jgi:hypothetical protein
VLASYGVSVREIAERDKRYLSEEAVRKSLQRGKLSPRVRAAIIASIGEEGLAEVVSVLPDPETPDEMAARRQARPTVRPRIRERRQKADL